MAMHAHAAGPKFVALTCRPRVETARSHHYQMARTVAEACPRLRSFPAPTLVGTSGGPARLRLGARLARADLQQQADDDGNLTPWALNDQRPYTRGGTCSSKLDDDGTLTPWALNNQRPYTRNASTRATLPTTWVRTSATVDGHGASRPDAHRGVEDRHGLEHEGVQLGREGVDPPAILEVSFDLRGVRAPSGHPRVGAPGRVPVEHLQTAGDEGPRERAHRDLEDGDARVARDPRPERELAELGERPRERLGGSQRNGGAPPD
eukprot:CAMPEP_0206002554 /NCGR_PEP_ID=MMETSP1464-20131121/2822_1 /ASSEMBLY_ACC=CAM_ASM_001124 /TAXON_ID=119497 /ORGANISM="Exanthemachrysis gayraliae, Strain RCC1523" /LENGTH=263 /DNA_ID=CAMNT_0053375899 /DNA_START=14 /DNA_END=804 /DNA_ORIENTATION=+